MKTALALLAAAAIAVPATPVFAKQVRVDYSDLNLSHPEGQKRLQSRVRSAAREVCDYFDQRIANAETRDCMDHALSQANVRVATVIEERANGG